MRPRLIELLAPWLGRDLADLVAPGFFAMLALACLLTTLLLVRHARRDGDDVADVIGVAMAMYAGAIVGGIAVPAVVETLDRLVSGGELWIGWAGMTSWAGFAGGFTASWLAVRRFRSITWRRFLDLSAAPLGLATCVARLGCFLAGCDFGRVSSVPWALRFPAGSPAWRAHVDAGWVPRTRAASLPVHPSQLYEAALGLALVGLALYLRRRGGLRPGGRFLVVVGAYAIGRFALELLRGDDARGGLGPASTGQIFAVVMVAACAATWWRWRPDSVHPARVIHP